MKTLQVTLEDDVAAFVEQAVLDGNFDSVDDLLAYAVGLVRTESVLGRYSKEEPPVGVQPPKPGSGVPVKAIDLTRKGFDGPAFMANLVGKLEQRRYDGRPEADPQQPR